MLENAGLVRELNARRLDTERGPPNPYGSPHGRGELRLALGGLHGARVALLPEMTWWLIEIGSLVLLSVVAVLVQKRAKTTEIRPDHVADGRAMRAVT
jgi:hypothetical protein